MQVLVYLALVVIGLLGGWNNAVLLFINLGQLNPGLPSHAAPCQQYIRLTAVSFTWYGLTVAMYE